jgi:N-acyl-D-aspartate/D-glutamate deacylase
MHNLWGKSDSLLALLDNARKTGVNVTSDIYPYAFWHSTIRVLFPGRNFSDEKEAETILKEITLPEDIILSSYEIQREYEGKSLATIARLENKTPARMLTELIARIEKFENENKRSCDEGILATSMDEADIKKLMSWHTRIYVLTVLLLEDTHVALELSPRCLVTIQGRKRHLHCQEAIYKMTGLSAEHMGIKRRGFIKKGYYATLYCLISKSE